MDSFKTSFGRMIKCVPGYLEAHPRATGPTDVFAPPGGFQGSTPFGIDGFIKDLYEYALMIDFLESLGVRTSWNRTLDIGGAEGTMGRLLRGEGRAQWSATLDLYDLGRNFSTASCVRHWIKFRMAAAFSRFSPTVRRFLLGDGEWRGKRLTKLYANFGYVPPPGSTFWRPKLRALPSLDKYIVQDIYTLDGQFDLITAFLALPCFDVERLFAKVSQLLPEGGMFYFISDYWWFPVNSTVLVGHFPYVAQRLTTEDFQRYVKEFHPDEYDDWIARYNYYHMGRVHPTLSDYIELAARFDMELLGSRRTAPPGMTHNRAVIPPRLLDRLSDTCLDEVLEDIHQFKPNVGRDDLMTNYVMAAFVKRAPRTRTLAQHLDGNKGSRQ